MKEPLKWVLQGCKLRFVYKGLNKLSDFCFFLQYIPKKLTFAGIQKYSRGVCKQSLNDGCIRHFNVPIGEIHLLGIHP